MHSPLVVPVSGYSTLSGFEMLSRRPAISTVVDGLDAGMPNRPALRALARPRLYRLHDFVVDLSGRRGDGNRIGRTGRVALASILGCLHARLERRHQIDDLRSRP